MKAQKAKSKIARWREKLVTILYHVHAMRVKFGELAINTLQVPRDQGKYWIPVVPHKAVAEVSRIGNV